MAAQYLREQVSSDDLDVGSLLMGFLDFYGNDFKPQTTGISVRHRMFFSRPRNQRFERGMPCTFDSLFVEDPLSEGNNVGRNAFRIVQVQRACSDAHRALVAALEWDMYSSSGTNEFPLLKCILQSEDVVMDFTHLSRLRQRGSRH